VEVLIHRAQSIVQDLGYTQPPADIAYGYDLNVDYLQRIRDTDPSPMRWEVLRDDRMAPLKFWYRQSRQPLWPVWTPPSGPPGVGSSALVSAGTASLAARRRYAKVEHARRASASRRMSRPLLSLRTRRWGRRCDPSVVWSDRVRRPRVSGGPWR
jgi:hypothetical protein